MEIPAPIWEEPIPFLFGGQGGTYDDSAMGSQSKLIYDAGSYLAPEYGIYLMAQNPLEWIEKGIDWLFGRGGPPKISTTEKYCIQLACSFIIAGGALGEVRNIIKKSLKELEEAAKEGIKKIGEGASKQKELEDCVKKAMSGKGWVYWACRLLAKGGTPAWRECAANTRTERECLACCDLMFKEGTNSWDLCKYSRGGCAGKGD